MTPGHQLDDDMHHSRSRACFELMLAAPLNGFDWPLEITDVKYYVFSVPPAVSLAERQMDRASLQYLPQTEIVKFRDR